MPRPRQTARAAEPCPQALPQASPPRPERSGFNLRYLISRNAGVPRTTVLFCSAAAA